MNRPVCWVVTDGKAGMENQCVGLAERLGLVPMVKRVRLRTPWRQLSPWLLRWGNRWSLSSAGDQLDGPLPDLLIATGRHSVSSSLAVGELSGGRCFRVQIQDPGIDPKHFDLVVVPRHDRLRGANVLVTTGALHQVSAATLAAARQRFAARLAALPRPRVAVLLGGSNGAYRFTPALARELADRLAAVIRGQGGSLMVTPSRRTDAGAAAVCREALGRLPGEFWDGTGDNPYLGYLAFADAVVVTSDSVNMVCEACATGLPVHVFELAGGSAKFRRFHDGLGADGITRPFTGVIEDWSYPPFDDTQTVADEIRHHMARCGWIWQDRKIANGVTPAR